MRRHSPLLLLLGAIAIGDLGFLVIMASSIVAHRLDIIAYQATWMRHTVYRTPSGQLIRATAHETWCGRPPTDIAPVQRQPDVSYSVDVTDDAELFLIAGERYRLQIYWSWNDNPYQEIRIYRPLDYAAALELGLARTIEGGTTRSYGDHIGFCGFQWPNLS